MKVLNLYSGLGGNRKLWPESFQITSVELDSSIAAAYKKNFPSDNLVIGDAHQYLLDNYQDFDLIWSSPPCPTHSRARYWRHKTTTPAYPDMKLYQEILYLKHHFKGNWIVENVVPYYSPLIGPSKKIGRHLFWSNFRIGDFSFESPKAEKMTVETFEKSIGIKIAGMKFKQRKDKIMRNCVSPEIGLHLLTLAANAKSAKKDQSSLF